jgi:hypothetical protein
MRAHPTWARVLGAALAVLVVNLLWNHPLREASGGAAVAFLALNLLPSFAAVAWATLGGKPRRR